MASDVVYLFYNLKNPSNPIIIPSNRPDEVSKTHFDKSKETILLLHGGGGNSSGPLVQKCRTALFNAKKDVNVIGIDWQPFQNRNKGINIYDCGKMFGANIGNFLKEMSKKFGLQFSRLSLVGHSIGGGVIGDIGVGIDGQARSIVSLEACTYKDRAKHVQVCSNLLIVGLGHYF